MAILKVRDEQGNIIEIPAIKGDKGERGDPASATDVQINGISIVENGVAEIPLGLQDVYGVMKLGANWYCGLEIDKNGVLKLRTLSQSHIDNRATYTSGIIHGANYDYAVKQAMCDGKGAEWTIDEKTNARVRMGIDREPVTIDIETTEEVKTIDIVEYDGKPLSDYDFKQMWVLVENVGGRDNASSELQVRINDSQLVYLGSPTGFINNASKQYWGGYFNLFDGYASSTNGALSMPTWRTTAMTSVNMYELAFMKSITKITLWSVLTNIPTGTKFKIILR